MSTKIETEKRTLEKETRRREARKRKIPRGAYSETHFAAVDSLLMQNDAQDEQAKVEKAHRTSHKRWAKMGRDGLRVTTKNQAMNEDIRGVSWFQSLSTLVDAASLFITDENTIYPLVRRHC